MKKLLKKKSRQFSLEFVYVMDLKGRRIEREGEEAEVVEEDPRYTPL